MLFSVDTANKIATPLPAATFAALDLKERFDIQEWVLRSPLLLGEELLVVSTEFAQFDRTSERLDVLAVDRRGKLVVVELKRTAVGTAAELQALRYAAFCSTFSLEDVAELYSRFLEARENGGISTEEAEERILAFVRDYDPGWDAFDNKPRIILAAQEFPPEITATVMWLRSFEVELSCVKLMPYRIGDSLVVDSSVLIPQPEAEDFLIRRARKEVEQSGFRDGGVTRPTVEAFFARAEPQVQGLARRLREWLRARLDVGEEVFKTGISYRAVSDRAWVTWMETTRRELRVALPPEADLTGLETRLTRYGGWSQASVRTDAELDQVIARLARDYGTRHLILETERWNGRDFYVSFGEGSHRTWEDARRYGFISAGQGAWYSRTLRALEPGHRIFVYIPQTGYVGVGRVLEPAVPVRDFTVEVDGMQVPILNAPLAQPGLGANAEDPEKSEYLVRVEWTVTLPVRDAVFETGMFANQNSACRLTHAFTRETLLERFGLGD